MKLPKGFTAGAVAAGLKPSGGLDVGLILSDRPASVAGVFTTNRVVAAPVKIAQQVVRKGIARAIAVNAGNANACTGVQGTKDARSMRSHAARKLDVSGQEVVIASTGIIGVPMDMPRLKRGLSSAAKALTEDVSTFSKAIMTTDTAAKIVQVRVGDASVLGVAKGSGMIAPELATMLCFILTDAEVSSGDAQKALTQATKASFDGISVDGCMSTNDAVILMANGAAGKVEATAFTAALNQVAAQLARKILEDGEGATHIVDIDVTGAKTEKMAQACARSVAGSVLFRCAVAGGDPNWGRILAALGASGQRIKQDLVSVHIGDVPVCLDGARGPGSLQDAELVMKQRDINIRIDLGLGDAKARISTNDLTYEYVRINAEYTT